MKFKIVQKQDKNYYRLHLDLGYGKVIHSMKIILQTFIYKIIKFVTKTVLESFKLGKTRLSL